MQDLLSLGTERPVCHCCQRRSTDTLAIILALHRIVVNKAVIVLASFSNCTGRSLQCCVIAWKLSAYLVGVVWNVVVRRQCGREGAYYVCVWAVMASVCLHDVSCGGETLAINRRRCWCWPKMLLLLL